MIRIMLAEDHPALRVGLKFLLDESNDIKVVAEAGDGAEAVRLAEQLKPDLILMDVGMPRMDGIQASKTIRQQCPDVKIIMLTSHDDEKDIFASLAAGANGYCLKETTFDRLSTAISAVASGDLWLDSLIAGKVLKALPQLACAGKAAEPGSGKAYESLSPRELDVLKLLVEGQSNQEIAKCLIISPETVKTHMRHIMEKLAASDRTQAAVKALRQGLVW